MQMRWSDVRGRYMPVKVYTPAEKLDAFIRVLLLEIERTGLSPLESRAVVGGWLRRNRAAIVAEATASLS